MKWLNGNKVRLMVFGIVAVIMLGSRSVKADFTFGEPVNLGPVVNSGTWQFFECMSFDGLELYLSRPELRGKEEHSDLWVCTRATPDDAWSAPVNLGPTINQVHREEGACISPDGLELYFCSWGGDNWGHPGGYGLMDIWVTRRPTRDADWGPLENLGPTINDSGFQMSVWVSVDGLELYFSRFGGNGMEIFRADRASKDDRWGNRTRLGPPVNTSDHEYLPALSADGLLLFFGEDDYGSHYRPGGFGRSDMWFTRRESPAGPWGEPLNLGRMVNSPSSEWGPRVSPDGRTLYFSSDRPGGYGECDIWQAPIIPITDFNGDRIVDAEDMVIMVDHWGEDYPLCDIGPMPWGDGVVDVQDLKVLAEHLFQDVYDPTLVVHWPFDETEGMVVEDTVGNNQAYAVGDPVWQPDGGQVDGALLFDGVDDFISASAVLNPADGPFSVFAWINGGAPDQVIIAQQTVSDWLSLDTEGNLMTDIKYSGRLGGPLLSEATITDGQWHRVGLVWDGSNRTLIVDDVVVAEDTPTIPESSDRGLYIGVGKDFSADTFFSGLIDDVRIYNRALSP